MDIPTLMKDLFLACIWIPPLLLLLAAVMHIRNLSRVRKLMAILQGKKEVSKALLYKEMTVSQGSNFTALAFASWIMLFVAMAYLYLLVPTVFHYSYMDLPELSSNVLGFAIFGLIVAALAAVVILFLDMLPEDYRNLKLTELYSFYSISKNMKRLIGMTVIALCISIVLSAYIGTIYPVKSTPIQLLSILLLIASAIILVAPVFKMNMEVRR